MELTKLKKNNLNSTEEKRNNENSEWLLSCGMLSLFFIGLAAVLGIIFTIFGKIILAIFMT